MKAFTKFNKGVLGMPIGWQLWLMALVAANGIGPLFFLDRPEAQAVLVAMMAGAALMTTLTARFGFSRILGLGHVFWLPLVAFLLWRLGEIPASDTFGIWIRAVIVLNGVSLVIDSIDVVRYFRGDRAEVVAGL